MTQGITEKFEEQKLLLEKELEVLENTLRDYSRQVSETQILILEKKGEIKGLEKMINLLKEK
jgi:glycerate kinase